MIRVLDHAGSQVPVIQQGHGRDDGERVVRDACNDVRACMGDMRGRDMCGYHMRGTATTPTALKESDTSFILCHPDGESMIVAGGSAGPRSQLVSDPHLKEAQPSTSKLWRVEKKYQRYL